MSKPSTKEKKIAMQTMVNLIIERFDDLEEETGVNLNHAKRIVLRLAKKHNLFSYEIPL